MPGWQASKIKNLYLRTDYIYIYIYTHTHTHTLIHTSSIFDNAFHDLTLIKMTVARLVGTGGFLNRYSIGHTEKKRIASLKSCWIIF